MGAATRRLTVEVFAVHAAVLQGFQEVGRLDIPAAFQVGNGAGDLENPVVASGAHAHALKGGAENVQND